MILSSALTRLPTLSVVRAEPGFNIPAYENKLFFFIHAAFSYSLTQILYGIILEEKRKYDRMITIDVSKDIHDGQDLEEEQ